MAEEEKTANNGSGGPLNPRNLGTPKNGSSTNSDATQHNTHEQAGVKVKKFSWSDVARKVDSSNPANSNSNDCSNADGNNALSAMARISGLLLSTIDSNQAEILAEDEDEANAKVDEDLVIYGYVTTKSTGRGQKANKVRQAVFCDSGIALTEERSLPAGKMLLVSTTKSELMKARATGMPKISGAVLRVHNTAQALRSIPNGDVSRFPLLVGKITMVQGTPFFMPSERTSALSSSFRRYNQHAILPISNAGGTGSAIRNLLSSLPKGCTVSCRLGVNPDQSFTPMVWDVKRVIPLDSHHRMHATEVQMGPITIETFDPANPFTTLPFADGLLAAQPEETFKLDVIDAIARAGQDPTHTICVRHSPLLTEEDDPTMTTGDIDLCLLIQGQDIRAGAKWFSISLDKLVDIYLGLKAKVADPLLKFLSNPSSRVNLYFDITNHNSSSQAYWMVQKSYQKAVGGHRKVGAVVLPWGILAPRKQFPTVAAIPGPVKSKAVCPALAGVALRPDGYKVDFYLHSKDGSHPSHSKNEVVALLTFSEGAKVRQDCPFTKIKKEKINNIQGNCTIALVYNPTKQPGVRDYIAKLVTSKLISYERREETHAGPLGKTESGLLFDLFHVLYITPLRIQGAELATELRKLSPWVMPLRALADPGLFVASSKIPLPKEALEVAKQVAYALPLDKHTFAYVMKATQKPMDISTLLKLGKPSEVSDGPYRDLLSTPGNPWAELADVNERNLIGFSGPRSSLAPDSKTVYINGISDVADYETTQATLRRLFLGSPQLTIVDSPEETTTEHMVHARYLRSTDAQRSTRNSMPLVLAVTSWNETTLKAMKESAETMAERTKHAYTNKLLGIHLLEVLAEVVPPDQIDQAIPTAATPSGASSQQSSYADLLDDDDDIDGGQYWSPVNMDTEGSTPGRSPQPNHRYSGFMSEDEDKVPSAPRPAARTPALQQPKEETIITKWVKNKVSSSHRAWKSIPAKTQQSWTKQLIAIVSKKFPNYHQKGSTGTLSQKGGLLKAIDQAVQEGKSHTYITKILGRAANMKSPNGYDQAVSELSPQLNPIPEDSENDADDWYDPQVPHRSDPLDWPTGPTHSGSAPPPKKQTPAAPSETSEVSKGLNNAPNKKRKSGTGDTETTEQKGQGILTYFNRPSPANGFTADPIVGDGDSGTPAESNAGSQRQLEGKNEGALANQAKEGAGTERSQTSTATLDTGNAPTQPTATPSSMETGDEDDAVVTAGTGTDSR